MERLVQQSKWLVPSREIVGENVEHVGSKVDADQSKQSTPQHDVVRAHADQFALDEDNYEEEEDFYA